jgi:hypothetical protein
MVTLCFQYLLHQSAHFLKSRPSLFSYDKKNLVRFSVFYTCISSPSLWLHPQMTRLDRSSIHTCNVWREYTHQDSSLTQFKQEWTTLASLSIANLTNFSKMQVNRDAIAIEYNTEKIWNSQRAWRAESSIENEGSCRLCGKKSLKL